ncbi:MAG TPA: hypothetical protein VGM05_21280 [Planctomycetaceae bacterium]|jgi:hypothetical protein
MHPAEFVASMIVKGRVAEVVAMIDRFSDKLSKTGEHAKAYNFAWLFLLSVKSQLRVLRPNQELHDDDLLSVWAELGYFGIDRDEIEMCVNPPAPTTDTPSEST